MVLAITSAQFLKKETVNKILITIVTLGFVMKQVKLTKKLTLVPAF